MFHAISGRVAETVFDGADDAFKRRVRRWIRHGDVRTVARWVSQINGTSAGTPPPHISALLNPPGGAHVDAVTAASADGFLELNDKREQADYDHDAVSTRPDTRGQIALAGRVVAQVEQVDTDALRRFYGLIAMQSRIQVR